MNPNALVMALIATACIGLCLFFVTFDDPCAECQHGRFSHTEHACSAVDEFQTEHRPCRCNGFKKGRHG